MRNHLVSRCRSNVTGLVLKPCCLPAMEYVKRKTRWTLGAHSFAADEVCMWGKYNRNKWQGPLKASMCRQRFYRVLQKTSAAWVKSRKELHLSSDLVSANAIEF